MITALGSPEQAINGLLQESVDLTRLRPRHDPVQMLLHEVGDLLHRFDLGADDAGAPIFARLVHDVDLLPIEALAQLIL